MNSKGDWAEEKTDGESSPATQSLLQRSHQGAPILKPSSPCGLLGLPGGGVGVWSRSLGLLILARGAQIELDFSTKKVSFS